MRANLILAIALLVCRPGTLSADITVYTDKTQWENAVGGQFLTEDFADDQLNPGVSFVSTETGHINPHLECYQDVLASHSQKEPSSTWSFTPPIVGFGGIFDLGGPGGSGSSLLVYVADTSDFVGAIPSSYNGDFWGFTSDTPLTSVKLVGGAGSTQQNYCMDDMVYAPVPEPGTACLMLGGLVGLLILRRRLL